MMYSSSIIFEKLDLLCRTALSEPDAVRNEHTDQHLKKILKGLKGKRRGIFEIEALALVTKTCPSEGGVTGVSSKQVVYFSVYGNVLEIGKLRQIHLRRGLLVVTGSEVEIR